MTIKDNLLEKIQDKSLKVGVIGLGYVGFPLVIRFAESGFRTLGFDIDRKKIESLNQSQSYLQHISSSQLAAVSKFLDATDQFSRIDEIDAIVLCLPTPLNIHREPDLGFITSTLEVIRPFLRSGQILSLESTTYPGTTEEVILPYLTDSGFSVGEDFYLVYSPEREDPGNMEFTTQTIPKICGGISKDCLEVGLAFYEQVIDQVVPVSSTAAAEMTKILENIHRAVNIGLVNEMKVVADKMGIDIREVIDAAATKPFGFVPYYPGPGLGGHCIPIDPYYLTWKARQYGVNTRFIELAGEVNRSMPDWVVDKVVLGLNQESKAIRGSKILIVGIAYKKDIGDMRESPAVEIMQLLHDRGAEVTYHDPFVPDFPSMRNYEFHQSSLALTEDLLSEVDAVVITTDHSSVDYRLIRESAPLIIDSRGVYKEAFPKLVKA